MLYLSGIIITFFLAILLISKKDKSKADIVLAIWLCLIGVHLQLFYLHYSGEYIHFSYLLGLEIPMPLLHGPFLYLYIRSLISTAKQSYTLPLHFLPAFVAYISLIPFLRLSSEEKISVYQHNGSGFESQTTTIFCFIILSGISYVTLSLYLFYKNRESIKNSFSLNESLRIKWVSYLIYGIGAIWIIVILGNDILTFASVAVFILLIGYLGIKQGTIFSNYSLAYLPTQNRTADLTEEVQEKIKYQKSTLKEEDAVKIHNKLSEIMMQEKLFKNPELSLGDLAERLDIHQNTLSQVINSFEQKHFYDYINELRIVEFKQIALTPDSQKYTLLSLAFDCGFNSKTTFNRTFKKSTGISPKEYLNQAITRIAA
ncbi:AraC family transcriptional regulator [Emticicia sp. BO119]|uniref:helix-turn-helix domain-containing protein n=1 Tax=Emticicia sp. BO119 TaxID=2757768 RepID=UPI0015F1062D|nr:helix-turn-helix domain-containing protein [Emticicia sp. BO119]MBA4851012.1 AraC family transcriptional regulator [Emticicia sp. BO119]